MVHFGIRMFSEGRGGVVVGWHRSCLASHWACSGSNMPFLDIGREKKGDKRVWENSEH